MNKEQCEQEYGCSICKDEGIVYKTIYGEHGEITDTFIERCPCQNEIDDYEVGEEVGELDNLGPTMSQEIKNLIEEL